jgi:uncharacterized membrane protein YjgN (DUF898 family)
MILDDSPASVEKPLQLNFKGEGSEYFKIWIVNIVLSILTLGIYSAWAKVRNKRYFYGNTQLDDSPFEYMATPGMILKGRIIAVGLLVIYTLLGEPNPLVGILLPLVILLLAPLIIRNAIRFNARMTSYRNVNFDFRGSIRGAYFVFLGLPFLSLIGAAIVTFGVSQLLSVSAFHLMGISIGLAFLFAWLLTPILQSKTASYFLNNSFYGQARFKAKLRHKSFFRIHLLFTLLMIGFVAINMILVGLFSIQGADITANTGVLGAFLYLQFLMLSVLLRAFLKAEITNYVSSKTQLENAVIFNATVSTRKLFSIYSVNILLLIITLGLARPWTLVRVQKYLANNFQAYEADSLAVFVAQQEQAKSSLGDEVGEAFDLGITLPV